MKAIIVGTSKPLSESSEAKARKTISFILQDLQRQHTFKDFYSDNIVDLEVGSGWSKGIDTMVQDACSMIGIKFNPNFRPKHDHWDYNSCYDYKNCYGFKARNLDMAKWGDVGYVIVKNDPNMYCYHCRKPGHLKSGACWTGQEMKKRGKPVKWFLI